MFVKKVYVGLSGGVDSSLSAALLVEQGYDVTGVFMKNWSQDLPGFECPWREDYQDAKRVAVQLGIPFVMYDFEKEYRQKVVDYLVSEYQAGNTPNPDIMCNQEIKFKLFLDTAISNGAEMIATGHYARTSKGRLLRAVDDNKDQTYFLYRTTSNALKQVIFPLGEFTKPEVRQMAEQRGLVTARKKESMGICFVGRVGIKDFLIHELGPQKPGDIVNSAGEVLGKHDGAIFYTIGQRHGLEIGGGLPYYVIGKDMGKNEVQVTTNIDDSSLWSDIIGMQNLHWIAGEPANGSVVQVRTRHRALLVNAKYDATKSQLILEEPIRALTPGQSTVIYTDTDCLGGGVVV
ncbi:tRNA 2-thiouridine(34) synthase MnmA [Candidatus Saccharibacteria bacterium]|nr:tRNA 2-thiouridine(34) synthase MnmA [Candidatus Saccharibacteria bacterium]